NDVSGPRPSRVVGVEEAGVLELCVDHTPGRTNPAHRAISGAGVRVRRSLGPAVLRDRAEAAPGGSENPTTQAGNKQRFGVLSRSLLAAPAPGSRWACLTADPWVLKLAPSPAAPLRK